MTRNIIGAYNIVGALPPYTAFGQDAPLAACPPYAPAPPVCVSPYSAQGVPPMGHDWSMGQWQAFQAALASRGSAAVVDVPPNRAREQYLGFVEGPLDAGQTASFIATPAQVFKPHRLVIPSDFAGAILVRNITVGNMPQLVNAAGAGSLPGRMFSEFSTDELINFDTAQISQQITLQVTNISGSDLPLFFAGLKGVAVMS
jgi:hypothetical protein